MLKLNATPLSTFISEDVQPQIVTYKTINTEPLTFALFTPTATPKGGKHPAVILIHGGAWVAGDFKVFFPQARYFALRGAVAISINYRLVKAVGPSVGDCLADCKSALRYVRSHAAELGIDPDKIAVMGDSAGGHLAAALGTCEGFEDPQDDLKVSALPNAMVLCNAIVDMTEGSWIKFIIRGEALAKKPKPADLIPTPEQVKLGRALSPLFQVKPGQPPTLLMHGLEDHIVTPDQARQFSAAEEQAHNKCQLILIPGAGHAFIGVKYTAPEPMVVEAIRQVDTFLGALGWWTGAPTLEVSTPPAWPPKK